MEAIGTEDIIRRLEFDNPWWAVKEGVALQFKTPPIRRQFARFYAALNQSKPGRVALISGVRRSGKSVMLRQALAALIEAGQNAAHICYVPLAAPCLGSVDLPTLLKLCLKRCNVKPDDRFIVMFDDLHYQRGGIIGLTKLAKAHPQIRFAATTAFGDPPVNFGVPPTANDGPFDLTLLSPLTFLEFLQMRGGTVRLFGRDPLIGKRVTFSQRNLPALNQEFIRYINFGSFPEGITPNSDGASMSTTFIRDTLIQHLLRKDLIALAGISDNGELLRFFSLLARNTACEVSIDELAIISSLAKNTVRKYLDFLESAHLIRRVPRLNASAQTYTRAMVFKLYLVSPNLYTALFGPVGANDPVFPQLAETAFMAQWISVPALYHLAYAGWRNSKVGFVALDHNTGLPWMLGDFDWSQSTLRQNSATPQVLGQFAKSNNTAAMTFVLTENVAQSASVGGTNVQFMPLALTCYWLQHDTRALVPPSERPPDRRAPTPMPRITNRE